MPENDPFKTGLELHRSGRLDEAERLYRSALSSRPHDPYVLVHLAMLVQSRGRLHEAIDLQMRGVAARPDFFEAWCNLGNMLLAAGRATEAVDAQRRALDLRPDLAEVWANLSGALRACGRSPDAIAAAQQACARRADFPEAHFQLGAALRQSGRYRDAVTALEQAVRLKPDSFEAWFELGSALQEEGKSEASVEALSRALALRPHSAEAACAMGNARCALDQWEAARGQYENSLRLKPALPEARIGLAAVQRGEGRPHEAADAYADCIRSQPDNVQAHRGRALALFDQGRFDEALQVFEHLARLHPSDASVQFELGMELLLRGEWSRGWALYEKRLGVPRFTPSVPGNYPWWDGGDLRGRRILLHHEQGHGDTIQFVRYVTMPRFEGARIVLRCQTALHALLKDQFDVEAVVADGEPLPGGIDCHCTFMSLPARFGTDESTIPLSVPYIRAAPGLVERWRKRLGERDGSVRVGVAWAGNPAFSRDRRRSMQPLPLFQMAAAFGDGVRWYNLRKSPGGPAVNPQEAGLNLIDFTRDFTDFAQTAAVIAQMDLVLTTDTGVAHLAGAMGVPVWLMLSFMPDWRWQLGRADSPWYPTMRLFRQPRPEDWTSVLGDVLRELRSLR